MFGKKRRQKYVNAIIREEEMKAQENKNEPYDGEIFIINGEKYVPICFYTDEYDVVDAKFIKYEKRHLIDLYIKIKGMQCGIKESLPVPREFIE